MKTIIFSLFLSAACLHADESPAAQFIRTAGTYQVTPNMSLEIAANSGILRYTFKRPGQRGDDRTIVTTWSSVDTPQGGAILFYWDSASETLWHATAKRIVSHGPNGSVAYDYFPRSPDPVPKLFRKEAERLFKRIEYARVRL
jgi:hypothetical protein